MQVNPEKFFLAMSGNYGEMAALLEDLPDITESDWIKVLRAWDRGGLLGLGKEKGTYRSWANVCAHQMVVARVGYCVARAFERPLVDCAFTPYKMVLALLVHDFDKQREVEWVAQTAHITFQAYEKEVAKGIMDLKEVGFAPDVALVANVSSEYGLDRILRGRATLPEMISFFADMTVSGSTATSFNDRLEALQKHFKPGGMYENWRRYYRERYGIDVHAELWGRAGRIITAEFRKYLGDRDFLGTPFEQLRLY